MGSEISRSIEECVIDEDLVDEWFSDLSVRHEDIETRSLLNAIINGNTKDLKTHFEYLDIEKTLEVVSTTDDGGNNCVQRILLNQSADVDGLIGLLLNHLANQNLSPLIVHANSSQQNSLHIAMEAKRFLVTFQLQQHLTDEHFRDHADVILSADARLPMITLAVEHEDNRLLKELTVNYPSLVKEWLDQNVSFGLSTQQIQIMAPSTDTFIIPTVQTRAQRFALICYNPTERAGSGEEAEKLVSAFDQSGFTVRILVWTCYAKMREWLVDETDKIKDEVSVLALFIMSHGSCGKLQGENGSVGQISDIIDETRKGIPLHIPMLVGIQACQGDGKQSAQRLDEHADVKVNDENDLNHVILRARNCSLIMATIYGEFAYRQNFVTAFSKELLEGNNSSIYEIFTATQRRIEADEHSVRRKQTLEFRCLGSLLLKL